MAIRQAFRPEIRTSPRTPGPGGLATAAIVSSRSASTGRWLPGGTVRERFVWAASVRPRGFIGGIEVFRADPLIKSAECCGSLPSELIPFPILKA